MTGAYELAQVNIARMRAPLDSPVMKDFVGGLDEVNAAAEASEGFVWRLVDTEGDNATGLRFYGDEWLIVNMSVWASPEALRAYVYGSDHRPFLQRRREWFEHLAEAVTALWWVPAGTRPTVAEAEARLTILREQGPTPEAFTLKGGFAEPEARAAG
ncbi:DUF3291 domain-containing protein [Glycomyces paridis]|uniref:DUF3291 domain-containing protein n=1 Tax=Glycomyces paridis TaxID=2126555 RepID=A0A4S8PDM3_9ACTN|nr:DUF3291 domain-containing protein [Glycomyces paridis]THV28467.1 DUF3291 domain-containing protein [Glycomyces paridis]